MSQVKQPQSKKLEGLQLKKVSPVQQLAEKSADRVMAMKAKIKNVGKLRVKC
jgi:hypothetical protein